MKFVMKRKVISELMRTYFPSLLVTAITFATTFFKPFFFELALSVNLTTMLVMTTIFISKMEGLPPTSDIKMIDIWLVLCQMVPFAEVVLLTAMEYNREKKNNGKKAKKKGKKDKIDEVNKGAADKSKEKTSKKEKAVKIEQPLEPKPEKKKDHPLKILDKEEPSSFVGDVWKKVYSNNPPEIWKKQFWEMYDPKGWSLWVCRFKYNHENEKQFMCANAIGGFVQRSDAVRKWAFGAMFVTGSEQDLPIEISGVWLMRGQSVEYLTEANDDALCYTWTKIDHNNQEMKDFVAEYWAADVDGYIEGKLVTDGKVFK